MSDNIKCFSKTLNKTKTTYSWTVKLQIANTHEFVLGQFLGSKLNSGFLLNQAFEEDIDGVPLLQLARSAGRGVIRAVH